MRKSVFVLIAALLAGCGQKTPEPKKPIAAEDAGPPLPPGIGTNRVKLKLPALPKLANKGLKLSPPVQMVTLTWDVSADPTVGSYNVYQGPAPRSYTNSVNVSPASNNIVVIPVTPGVTNYFAATAVTTNGLESVYSNEVSYSAPTSPPLYVIVYLQASTNVSGTYTNFSNVILTNPAAPQLFFKLQIIQTNSPTP